MNQSASADFQDFYKVLTSKLRYLHDIQDSLNAKFLGPEWVARAAEHQEVNYPDAILDEAAELLRSDTSWKFWSKAVTANVKNERVEYIDILHFLMSESMTYGKELSIKTAADCALHPSCLTFVTTPTPRNIRAARNSLRQLVASCRSSMTQAWIDFFTLGRNLGLTLDEVYAFYCGKAVLNAFRITNGYKTGEYIKEWSEGKEDNDHLTEFIEQKLQTGEAPTEQEIQEFLTSTYTKVKL